MRLDYSETIPKPMEYRLSSNPLGTSWYYAHYGHKDFYFVPGAQGRCYHDYF